MRGEIGVAHERADAQTAIGRVVDRVEPEAVDVDEVRRCLDLEFHEIEKIGAARDELRARRLSDGGGAAGRRRNGARS